MKFESLNLIAAELNLAGWIAYFVMNDLSVAFPLFCLSLVFALSETYRLNRRK